MSQEEKDELRGKIQKYNRLNAKQRYNLRHSWEEMSREKLRILWQSVSQAERSKEREKLAQMNRDER